MKVTFLYGDDENKKITRYNRIIDALVKRGWEIVNLDKKDNILESLRSTSFFDNKKLFVILDVHLFDLKVLKWASKNLDQEVNVLLVSDSKPGVKIAKAFGKTISTENFELPKILFQFLDSIYPKNSKNFMKLYLTLLKKEPLELIFSLVAQRICELYWVNEDARSLNYPPWRTDKLKKQAMRYSKDLLKSLINKLALIDVEAKSGKANLSLSLDLFMLKDLE